MFTEIKITSLQNKLDAVLAQFAKDNGLVAGSTQVRYGATEFKATVSFSDMEANPNEVDPRFLQDLDRRGWQLGLTKEMVGKIVVLEGRKGMARYAFQGMRASKIAMKEVSTGQITIWRDTVASKIIAQIKAM